VRGEHGRAAQKGSPTQPNTFVAAVSGAAAFILRVNSGDTHLTNRLADMNALLESADQCIKGSGWKESAQRFEACEMLACYALRRGILGGTLEMQRGRGFVQMERGKARYIKAPAFADRVVQKTLVRKILLPAITPLLIYDNGASIEGKGNDFARKRFECHIRKHFRERGDNGGYILFGDFSKYFDNLLHSRIKEMCGKYFPDDGELEVFCRIIDNFRPDVSYMSDEEYGRALHEIYNSMEHMGYEADGKSGRKKLLAKGCDIGAELSQPIGVFYPHAIDNWFKIVRGVRFYGRYMDDTYFIGDTVEELVEYRRELKEQADKLGIFLNEKKTRIVPIRKPFVWLKTKYTLTGTGRLVRNLNHDGIVRERRRIKYLARQLERERVTKKYAENCYRCWRQARKKFDTHHSIECLDRLYREIIGPINVYKS